MERLMFSFHKTINAACRTAASFTRGSPVFSGAIKKQYIPVLHLTHSGLYSLCTFQDIFFLYQLIFCHVTTKYSSTSEKV